MSIRTIAAIATAQGQGGIGVVRVSGDNAIFIVEKIFKSVSGKKLQEVKGYTAHYGKIFDDKEEIDEAIVTVFRQPYSYTGENVVEISCHGGLYITKKVLETVFKQGAVPAEPGEFTKRAFFNGKMELTQAESIMEIIGAKGRQAARAALSVRNGALSKKIEDLKQILINIAAHLSVWADYPEDDIPEVEFNVLKENIVKVEAELKKLLSGYISTKAIREGIDTVIIGKPNVGKSTLMNALSGCERCIVTDVPGTTRDIIEETILLGDLMLKVSDTAGIRETDNLVESIGVEKAKDRMKEAELVLAVFDASRELDEDDFLIINSIKEVSSVAIINKSDLEKKIDDKFISKNFYKVIYVSAQDGKGIEELENAISDLIGFSEVDPSEGILANERQKNVAQKALECVIEAKDAISCGFTLDAITVSLEAGISELLNLTGERATEAVVDRVFSKFCVGK